ncbi:2-hydroxyglutaryl-CoA dehydratase subunit D [Gottschalkia acidurici 9a]|uniref:2-hydroxyglutaryl-CoA dehydratase subunit D n=1 Tax=Gottschalkia acidurici (strain ATCC 7906 / DSM 604 / BCRC 14475 / CIP 104303 / KCTC 5404 / NCIMB 10678 / 9a) TaxID=1128398 RepID=K0AYM1_GOTA9|nr:double-cubane-cluster-containing anaerobic reductase [Gottschalkia acidurici]AFS77506.1 2-hydroxyglutaryl-CoA dehydratase subunit D [Gottschalkia acidurici 9a]
MNFNLPKAFNEFDEARQQGFMNIKELKEQGKHIIGTYCVYTPYEIMIAGGAIPISLCSMSDESIPAAEKHLPRNLCPLIKASYGFAITDTCPYFYFADLIVGETTCDGKKKMFEYMNEVKPVHVMQLPQVSDTEDAFNLWRNEMVRLKERIEKELNVTITDEDLKKAIKSRNEERVALKEFYELSKLCPPPMTGMEMLSVLFGSTFKTDQAEKINSIKEVSKNIMDEYNSGVRKVSEDAPRILITGCPIGGATQKVVKLIEEAGGVVVCYENCTGVKSYEELVDETIEPYDALTKKYLNIPCSCMSPNDGRLKLLDNLVDEYKVDGVIDMILQACHTYNVETFRIKNFVNGEKNIPYMSLETDYSQSDIGQLQTRISAFVEML